MADTATKLEIEGYLPAEPEGPGRAEEAPLTIDAVEEAALASNPEADLGLLRRAYLFASSAHAGQLRESGSQFIQHPLWVAMILAGLQVDTATVAAGLLHDVVEDTSVAVEDVEREFGQEIASLVDGVTKLGRLENKSRLEQQAENLRKMFLAMAKDIRVIIIKLADRLHNMRTLRHLPPAKRLLVSHETLEIYAPLAHRLGMWRFKWELEDLAFYYLNPQAYLDLVEKVARKRKEREEFTARVIGILREKLAAANIEADVQGRAKHFYSIYKKMTEQGKSLSEIYDLIAVRVIVNTVKDCYAALGISHSLWKPMPGRFKDYIAMPKSNMYQSLHTTVMGPEGEPFEIQIRTWEMHRTAEYGIAAHWKYKEGGKTDEDFERKLSWLRQVLEWQRELRDAREFMESLKIDLFDDEVFVFTPKGDVIDLPAQSTPLDFAYRIHTEVGHRCVGAKVNGRIVPLDYTLKNGEIVEILTSKSSPGPSADWLKVVRTSGARNKIRQWFKKERREENLLKGKEMVEREIARLDLDLKQVARDEFMEEVARKLSFSTPEDMLATVGFGGLSPALVASRLRELWRKSRPRMTVIPGGLSQGAPLRQQGHAGAAAAGGAVGSPGGQVSGVAAELQAKATTPGLQTAQMLPGSQTAVVPVRSFSIALSVPGRKRADARGTVAVKVKGLGNMLVRFARCCNPVPGDDIIGYVTRGRGVSVHRLGCPNVNSALNDDQRLIEVSWDREVQGLYPVQIEVVAADRPGLLSDVASVMAETGTNIVSARATTRKRRTAVIDMTIEIKDLDELTRILQKIQRIKDVESVTRLLRKDEART